MYHRYIHVIEVPGGSHVLDIHGNTCITVCDIQCLYLDVGLLTRDMGNYLKDDIIMMIEDRYEYTDYSYISSLTYPTIHTHDYNLEQVSNILYSVSDLRYLISDTPRLFREQDIEGNVYFILVQENKWEKNPSEIPDYIPIFLDGWLYDDVVYTESSMDSLSDIDED